MADMLDASGLADFRRNRRASDRKRECQCQETHGGCGQYIGLGCPLRILRHSLSESSGAAESRQNIMGGRGGHSDTASNNPQK